ncbi:MAG TPA: Pls/PosA family non-ribosomal peptide synthetase [Gemmatimonadales bacterium]|jgi:non-ribosomal peptide synthetase-like protein
MTAVVQGATSLERDFAQILAEVLRSGDVSVEDNFFDDLGADSLVMAQFCARARKRGLPSISMKDVYAHPTIRSLAVAVADTAPPIRPSAQLPSPTPTNAREYVLCGALQALFYIGYSYLGVIAAIGGYQALVAGAAGAERFVRLVLFGAISFLVLCAVPIAAKWLLIGRWTPRQIRLWSLDYVRFWVVKTLIRSNPAPYLFVGSPLYGLYLRALGTKVGAGALILSRRVPVCTDLLTIGAGTVLRRETSFLCYRAHAGRIETGPVTLGRNVYVGEMSVLDIDTRMGDGAQLGHASALHKGQTVPAGERWHGSPAQRTDVDYVRVPPARSSGLRRGISATLTFLAIVLLYVPLLEGGVDLLSVGVSSLIGAQGLLVKALAISFVLFFGLVIAGLLALGILPRVLRGFIKPDTVYPLYGFRYSVYRVIGGLSRMRLFPLLFGDSSYIVHFLKWVGWRLTPLVQTGSNFGSEVMTTNPFLTSVGTGTMIADGLNVFNDDISSTSFRVSRAVIGPRNFLGNYVNYPAGGRTGENCLLGTKVMVPIDGKIRAGVGLLGSPPFEIPRSVERDSRFDHLRTGAALRDGLAAKNRFNLQTMGIFLLTRWLGVFLLVLIDLVGLAFYDVFGHIIMATLFALSAVVAAIYYALVERCFESLGPPPPRICSIYDPGFWWVERVWKLHPISFLHLFDGTPFKSVLWRLIGVRFGKRVFDDGVFISEPTLTVIGDECALNQQSIIQCDSQEDGTYKSGTATIGARCTIGVGAFVHYDVTMEDGAVLAADSFLMKGETIPRAAQWGGNPAREM